MHLTCNMNCGWISSHSSNMSVLIMEYLTHCIKEHWNVLEYAHKNPAALDQAKAMLMEDICSESSDYS